MSRTFPSSGGSSRRQGQPHNTRCVIYNYKEGWFSQGRMSRSAGNTSAYNAYTVMADGLVAFRHELGSVYGNADLPLAETFDLNLDSGSNADDGQATASLTLRATSRMSSTGCSIAIRAVRERRKTRRSRFSCGLTAMSISGLPAAIFGCGFEFIGPEVLPVTVGPALDR